MTEARDDDPQAAGDNRSPGTATPSRSANTGRAGAVVDWVLILLVFFVHGGGPVPDVNEPHYLSKARHFWNPDWCEHDFFLQSADAHAVFYYSLGWLTTGLSLTAAAWVGRWLSWGLMAWGWAYLVRGVVPRTLAAPFAAALFVLLDQRADLSGEWIVGGFEAKGLAYAAAFLAVGGVLRGRWLSGFVAVGVAMAFHPLVGGWTALGLGFVWIAIREARPGWARMLGYGAIALLLSLPGVLPALALSFGQPASQTAEAARIYVYERLPHHLALLTVPPEKLLPSLLAHGAVIVCFLLLLVLWSRTTRDARANLPVRRIAAFTVAGVVVAGIGFSWELLFGSQPLIAARFLRYYFYRLSDFSVPLGLSVLITLLATTRKGVWPRLLLVVALAGATWHLADVMSVRWERNAPRAETPRKIRNAADWYDVCRWIEANTPEDAVFLTPRMSLTFKWRANRAEVVTRKDVPQDAAGILEWWERMNAIHARNKPDGKRWYASPASIDTDRMRALARKYGFSYVLSRYRDRLELPVLYRNGTFAVYGVD